MHKILTTKNFLVKNNNVILHSGLQHLVGVSICVKNVQFITVR